MAKFFLSNHRKMIQSVARVVVEDVSQQLSSFIIMSRIKGVLCTDLENFTEMYLP